MWCEIAQPHILGIALEDEPEALARQAFATMVQEQRLGLLRRATGQLRPRNVEVFLQRGGGRAADRQDALAAALANAAYALRFQVQIFEIQRHQLADAYAGGVQKLEHALIAEPLGGRVAQR